MTARRLAVEQPVTFELSAKATRRINNWVKKYPEGRQRSALIPALWIVQKEAGGWLPEPALRLLGDMLDMAYIRVYEVATFYTMFNLEPVGVHHVQLCGTTPCWLRGSDDIAAVLKRRVGPKGSRSADGMLSWIEVECLGACVNAPMAQISNAQGDAYYEDLTAENFEALLDDLVAGGTPEAGPQTGRQASAPEGGATVLLDLEAYRAKVKKKLPNTDKVCAPVTDHSPDAKGRRATAAGRKTKPKAPKSTKVKVPEAPKVEHERSVDAKTDTKDASKMKAPAKKAAKITKRKPVQDAKGAPTPDPKGAAVAPRRRTSGTVPQVLYPDGPTDGAPDDLKRIKGIGPKFESELNAKGVYYYRQIGAWTAADVTSVEGDALSRYPGRIQRDGWIEQARTLANLVSKDGSETGGRS